ncbi:MAG: 50S ribosomal protein L6, partial [Bauldia sp.]|nr:50S ribosomal protein L6 [Bauldia sp.]
MSRIGKNPVSVPKGVTATIDGQAVSVKGPKGELAFVATDNITVKMEDGAIAVAPRDDSKSARAAWGMSRSMVANLIEGVTKGFERRLEINGVGYRASIQGKNLQLALGYSHDVRYPIPEGIKIETPKPTE